MEEEKGGDSLAAYRKAVEGFTAVLKARPSFPQGDYRRGFARFRLGRALGKRKQDPTKVLEAGLTDFQKASETRKGDPRPHYRMGDIHRELGRYAATQGEDAKPHLRKALACYETSLERVPSYWASLRQKALVLEELGRNMEALAAMKEARDLSRSKAPGIEADLERLRKKVEGK
jgi:tetratricopeptide (TPR) repeat protein